jgi:hypothetical protein
MFGLFQRGTPHPVTYPDYVIGTDWMSSFLRKMKSILKITVSKVDASLYQSE